MASRSARISDGSSHFFSPESAIAAEIGLGADIIMAFDECTEYPAERSRAQASMEMTLRWAKRSKEYFEAHKEEVPWYRHSPFAVRSSPEPRLKYQAHPSRDGTSTVRQEQIPRFARDDNQETR